MLYVLLKIFNIKNLKVNLLLYFFRILIFVTPRPPGIFCLFFGYRMDVFSSCQEASCLFFGIHLWKEFTNILRLGKLLRKASG